MLEFIRRAQRHVISIGECMVELARGDDGRFGLAYGGDTFNTAIYLARCGVDVSYATLLGDDPYSHGIIDLARAEGVSDTLIEMVPGRNAGLYLIETATGGERSFYYWRDRAPARDLFNGEHAFKIAAAMNDARLIYLSGITLSLYDVHGLDALEAALAAAKLCGARVAIDSNYRPRGWGDDDAGRRRARAVFERFFRLADIALPTFDDEQMLWGDTDPAACIARLESWGIAEIVLKQGAAGARVASGGVSRSIPVAEAVVAVDTTAAGDSFNAAYLASRLAGKTPDDAADDGHALACIKIRFRGAIMPRDAMPITVLPTL